jgi:ABC-type transport system involved in Fe-S cluster assembly fused permease/ATPase subunit
VTLWRKKFRKSVAKNDNNWHDICTDSLINFETVKYFTAEKYEIERFSESIKEYQNSSVNVQASLSFLNISQMILMQLCLASALILATYGIQKRNDCCVLNGCPDPNSLCCSDLGGTCGGMEVGDFVAVLTYSLNLFQPLNFLGSVYNAIVMAMVDLRNLSELLAEKPDLTDAADAMELPIQNENDSDIAVEFDNVFFKYPSQVEGQGLRGVSFKMKRGTTTAIVGTTGAGKTTISRLFFRFYDVTEGAVKINGVDVRAMKQKSLREAIGVVPQSTSMFNDSLQQNVRYGKRDATLAELDKVAESAQLLKFIRSLPDGWDTVVGDRGLKLSGGEKQRTAIARCLLKDPPFVVLDEATSALDSVTESSIQEALDALGSHRTCLVIAHRLGTIRNADNIVVLGDGVVLEQVSVLLFFWS